MRLPQTLATIPTQAHRLAALALCTLLAKAAAGGAEPGPFASTVVDFAPGTGGSAGFDDPLAALGEPARFTGEGLFPSVVSPFSPPFLLDEIVSIGSGGWIVLSFDPPIVDDPANPFGADFIVFGNAGFIDDEFPLGTVGGIFSDDGGVVEVSADGRRWLPLAGPADGLFPTNGWLDAGPFDSEPGRAPSDFTRPVDPALTLDDVVGLDYRTLLALYDGSGGGAAFDLAPSGLAAVAFVRISVPGDAFLSVELDAVADVRSEAPSADLNGDGTVDGADLGLLLAAWGGDGGPRGVGDLNRDGVIDGADLGLLLAAFEG